MVSKYVKIMSVVSVKNLKSVPEYCIDCDTKLSGKENTSMVL